MARDYEPRRDDRNRNNKRWDGKRQDGRSWGRKDQGSDGGKGRSSGGQWGRRDDRRDDRRDNRRDDRKSYGRDDRRDQGRGDRKSFGRDDRKGYGRGDRRDQGKRGDRRDGWKDGRGDGRRDDRRDRGRGGQEEQEPRFPGQRSTGRPRDDHQPRRGKPHTKEYRSPDPDEPVIPAGVSAEDLDGDALAALRTLGGANQEIVARHLVAAGQLIDFDAEKAYKHAQAAVKRAGRVDVVREAAALTAYATGRYEEALREVRAVRRMRGDDSLRAIEADSERGLGRPEKALEVVEAIDLSALPLEEQVEVVLVAAGARQDLEQEEAALVLVGDALDKLPEDVEPDVAARLMSLQADLLRGLGREEEAVEVEEQMPLEDEEMEILDVVELLESDVDHTNTPLRGSREFLQERYDGLVLDLDGVCFAGTAAIPHASESIRAAKDEGMKLSFATNNASRSPEEITAKLEGFDIPAEPREIMTSAMNLMYLLEEELDLGARVLVIGSKALKDEVKDTGFELAEDATEPVDAVVQGFAEDVGWKQLSEAAYAINGGARYYATNLDTTLPLERGMAIGNGSLVAAVSRATGARPASTGKPKPEIVARAAQFVGATNPLAVGDRLETDIAAAVAAGMPSLHVLTGVSTAKQVVNAEHGERPTFLAIDLRGLTQDMPQPKHHKDGTWTAGVSQPVRITRWGNAVIGGYELRGEGDPVTLNLDTYRALAAAAWEAIDDGNRLRIPTLNVVGNDDETGYVQALNYEDPDAQVDEEEAAEETVAEELVAEEAGAEEAGAEEAVVETEVPEAVVEEEAATGNEAAEEGDADAAAEEVVAEASPEEPEAATAKPAVVDAEVVDDPREHPYGEDEKGTDLLTVVEEEPGELVVKETAETDGD